MTTAAAWPVENPESAENSNSEPDSFQAPAFPDRTRFESGIAPRNDFVPSVSDALVALLADLGVTQAYGINGGAIAPFSEALNRSSIELYHFRHETGAAFAAIEASLASGRPVVVFATTGPGLTNCLTGMMAARCEGARVIFVSATTGATQRGRGAFQETSGYTLLPGLFSAGALFDQAALIEQPSELAVIAARLSSGMSQPGGFVVHLGLPTEIQSAPAIDPIRTRLSSIGPPTVSVEQVECCAELLGQQPFAIWVGFGARHAWRQIRELAERTGAPVLCSPRAKGVFPESHPQFVGVTGFGGHASVERHFAEHPVQRMLVLGSRLGEFTSFFGANLVPELGLIHVDLDPRAFGAAYPAARTIGVQADIATFVSALCHAWPASAPPAPHWPKKTASPSSRARAETLVRPSYLMACVQRTIVEGSDAIVLTEAGNSFALGTHYLRFDEPGRYRVSTGFGSMGHAVCGVVGAALGGSRKAVAIAGDGAMLMQNEISTAVQYGIDGVWLVLNDARYNMIDQGMRSLSWTPFSTELPHTDFVMLARAMGADGVRVSHEHAVDAALELALRARGPFVVDVQIDPDEPAPSGKRNQSLARQGVK